jgi:hypothetical protein
MAKAFDDILRGAAIFALAMIPGVGAVAATFFRTVGINIALGGVVRALTPTPKTPKLPVRGTVSGGTNPMPLVFGTRRVGGQLAYVGTESADTQKLWYVQAHTLTHAGGVEDITDVYIDGNTLTDSVIDGSGNVTSGTYEGWVVIDRKLGTDSDTVNADFNTGFADVDSTFTGKGIAKTYFKFMRDGGDDAQFQKVFPNGIPTCSVLLKGIKCYDSRLDTTNGGSGSHRYTDVDTWEHSENPAVIAATYAIMEWDDGGCGLLAATEINWTAVAAAANICDETRDVPDGVGGDETQVRYECHIALSTALPREENLTKIIGSMAGAWTYSGGKLGIYAGAYDSPTHTITESWIRGGVTYTPRLPIDEIYNAVKGSFDNAGASYRTEMAKPYTNSTFESDDGGRGTKWQTIDLSGTTNQYQAQYLQNIMGRRSRKTAIRLSLNARGLDIKPWDTATVTLTEIGINSVFRVVDWQWTPDGPDIVAIGESSSFYSSTFADDYVERNPVETPALTEEAPATPTGLGATGGVQAIVLTWDTPPGDVEVVIYASDASAGTYYAIGTIQGSSYTERVSGGTTRYYKITFRRRNTESSYSSIVSAMANVVVTGTTIPDWASSGAADSDTDDGAGGINLSPGDPSAVAAGDLLVLQVGAQAGAALDSITVDTPTGWTLHDQESSTSGRETQVIFYKRYTGGGISPNVTGAFKAAGVPTTGITNVAIAQVHRFTTVLASGSPFDGAAQVASAASTSVIPVNITTTVANTLACQFVFVAEDETLASFTTEAGVDYAEVATAATTAGGDIAIQLQVGDKAAAGAITGGTYAIGTSQISIKHGFGLKPVA